MMGKRSLPLDRVSKEKQTHPLRLLPDSSSVLVRSQEARGVSLSLEPEPGTRWGRAGPPPLQQEAQPPDPAPGGTLLLRSQRPAGSVPWLRAHACGTGRLPSPVETGVSEHLWLPLGVGPRKVHKKEWRLGATRGTPVAPAHAAPARPSHPLGRGCPHPSFPLEQRARRPLPRIRPPKRTDRNCSSRENISSLLLF